MIVVVQRLLCCGGGCRLATEASARLCGSTVVVVVTDSVSGPTVVIGNVVVPRWWGSLATSDGRGRMIYLGATVV